MTNFKLNDEEKLNIANLVNSSLSEVFIFDASSFEFIYINKGAIKNIGYSIEELGHMHPWDIKPVSKDEFLKMIQTLTHGDVDSLDFETKHIRKDETEYDVQVRLEKGMFGKRECYFANILDITERVELVADIVRTSRLATAGEMIHSIGHEINNPIMMIDLHTSSLLNKVQDGEELGTKDVLFFLDKVSSATGRISKITSNLRNFSQTEDNDNRVCNVNTLIVDAITFVANVFHDNDIRVKFELANEKLNAFCSPIGFQQVIINLTMNAKDALLESDSNREIIIKTKRIDDLVQIIVQDSGPGINEDLKTKIFESFFTTKYNSGGTGLGLSISKKLMKYYGGDLSLAKSEELSGACFVLELPFKMVD